MENRYQIFVIEDCELYSTMINYVLTKDKDITTLVFNNAEDCLNYSDYEPDLIVLDHNLNGNMDGLTALKLIKTKYIDKPVIIMSSQLDIDILFKYIDNGATDYIVKNLIGLDLIQEVVNDIRNKTITAKKFLSQLFTHFKPE